MRAFARLSTSLKILIVLSLALLPLGMIASLASLETAKTNRSNRQAAARLLAMDTAERFNLYVDRVAGTLRAAQHQGVAGCRNAVRTLEANGVEVALFNASGQLICASRPLTATLPLRPLTGPPLVAIDSDGKGIRVMTASPETAGLALAFLPRDLLVRATHPHAADGSYSLRLQDSTGAALGLAAIQTAPLGRQVLADLPVASNQLHLSMTIETTPLSANEVLLTLLPILMWISGAAIGWLVVDRLILRPLAAMQAAIEHYRLTGRYELPPLTTPAFEIRTLARAFQRATLTINRHEADLEAGLARQTRLTREVHHRVKNNLQVVGSLLNIHARGAPTPEASDAYSTIQRRVEALSLVHRNHYAEWEENQGIALRPLIGELASNLRASLPGGAIPPVITLRVALLHAHQDVAISVAFLLVETIEVAMTRIPGTSIAIQLDPVADQPHRARLSIFSPALCRDAAPVDAQFELFERVVGGLGRQLRAPLDRDNEKGLLTIEITVMEAPDTDEEGAVAGEE